MKGKKKGVLLVLMLMSVFMVAAAGSQRGKTEHDDTAEVCEKRL